MKEVIWNIWYFFAKHSGMHVLPLAPTVFGEVEPFLCGVV